MSGDLEELLDPKALEGEGATEMVCFPHRGRVIVRYREPRLWVGFDAGNAVEFAKRMIDCAVECGASVMVQVPRRKITPLQRDRLINRAVMIFRNLDERGKSPAYIARHVVDSILSAID